jgi:serine/threonine-protein kinase
VPTVETWRRILREGLRSLTDAELGALRRGLVDDDPALLQGALTCPPPLECLRDWQVEGADLLAYPGWQARRLAGSRPVLYNRATHGNQDCVMSEMSPLDQRRRADQICDRFEAAWMAAGSSGRRPRLEDYLAQTPTTGRDDVLRELILLDLHYLAQAGYRPTPDYHRRFPALDPSWLADACTRSSAPAAADTTPKLAIPLDAIASADDLVAVLRRCDLLTPAQLGQLTPEPTGATTEPKALARELLRREWLTAYQLNQLFQGKGHELVLGSYVLLERLGEGGMGQVFKARHRKLDRLVALKLIRKERLASAAVLRRFRQEIQAAAQLEHRHIVRAHDAEEVGGVTFLVLDYVEGTDLGKLVRQQGPLPVARACDFVRQAALGLQHAFEKGMVHRDIKPSNLLLGGEPSGHPEGRGGTVKILDLGLARLSLPPGADSSTTLTEDGAVMGTPDFMAPEQAEESHTVDIRADIYSLGCTFYFLLAGRAPFAVGTLAQNIRRHLLEEPPPLEALRHDLPPGLPAVLRKMLAKRPEDRYQTPAEFADAVAALTPDALRRAPAAPAADTGDSALGDLAPVGPAEGGCRPRRDSNGRRRGGAGCCSTAAAPWCWWPCGSWWRCWCGGQPRRRTTGR